MALSEIPEGHISVLVEFHRDRKDDQDLLVRAANKWLSGANLTEISAIMGEYSNTRQDLLPSFQIDTSYAPVPIGPGDGFPETSLVQLVPENSDRFLLRCFIESNREIPERLAGGLVHSDPPIAASLTCGNSPAVGDASQVKSNLRIEELWDAGYDGSRVALAIVDTGIYLRRITKLLGDRVPGTVPAYDTANSWPPVKQSTLKPFHHRLGHGTMCAYDALIAAPRATLLDIAMLLETPGGHNVQATVAAAVHAFSFLANRWVCWNHLGSARPYDALVINNSWGTFHPSLEHGMGVHRFIDNPHHAFRLHLVKPMAEGKLAHEKKGGIDHEKKSGIDIVFASNNCGPCPSATCLGMTEQMIMGGNAYKEVLTVGGCDNNRDRVGYSSEGPSIHGMYPKKPDITGYTHFLGSKTRRTWTPDAGVSAACAVASGCVAALRTGLPTSGTPPKELFDAFKSTAITGNGSSTVGGEWNPQYGYGIINPVDAAVSLGLTV